MADKLDLESKDLIAEKLDQLQSLFPNLVTEGENGKVLDLDQLKNEFSTEIVEGTKERYRLEWPGKKEAIVTANLPTTKTLRSVKEKKEFVLSKQVIRSGTAIGALYREAEFGQSKKDFIHKLGIAQKEANETLYWLELLKETTYLDEDQFISIHQDAEELIKLLTSIIKSAKTNN